MGHIHTNPGEHDPTACAFIVRTDTPEPRLLLHQHKILKTLLPPGGHNELTETPWQGVCREISEETGYNIDQLEILQPKLRIKKLTGVVLHPQTVVDNTHNFDPEGTHKHTDRSYAFVTKSDPKNLPADGESTEFMWVTAAELQNLEPTIVPENIKQIGQFVLTELLTHWVPVKTSEFER